MWWVTFMPKYTQNDKIRFVTYDCFSRLNRNEIIKIRFVASDRFSRLNRHETTKTENIIK